MKHGNENIPDGGSAGKGVSIVRIGVVVLITVTVVVFGTCCERRSGAGKGSDCGVDVGKEECGFYMAGGKSFNEALYQEAYDNFNRAIAINPEFKHAYTYRGKTLYHLGWKEDAIADFLSAVELGATMKDFQWLAFIHKERGDYNRAIDYFDESIKLHSTNAYSYFNRGVCYHWLGMWDEAFVDFDKTLELSPKHQYAREWIEYTVKKRRNNGNCGGVPAISGSPPVRDLKPLW